MRSARGMARGGASYDHAFVVDSLCCVSRSATFTGQYPHQTGVRTNTANLPNRVGPMGGWRGVRALRQPRPAPSRCGSRRRGYMTGYVGKYLNGYEIARRRQALPPVPPGWTDFRAIFGSAYDGWGFQSTRTTDKRHQVTPQLAARRRRCARDARQGPAVRRHGDRRPWRCDFLRSHAATRAPYFLEVAPYAPHSRVDANAGLRRRAAVPAGVPRPAGPRPAAGNCGLVDCRDLTVRDLPGFGDRRADNRPRWADGTPARGSGTRDPLGAHRRRRPQNNLRDRARMAQSVDRLVLRILRTVDDNTYVVLTSDNGFHLGQHGLLRGKGTPYDTDMHVPLLVVGPGVVPGTRTAMVSNIDLAPTFEDARRPGLAGVPVRASRSCRRFADPAAPLQDYVFFEHTFSQTPPGTDPDRAVHRRRPQRDPVVRRGAQPHRPARRATTSTGGWDHERYAYEFYDYTSAAVGADQPVRRPGVRRRGRDPDGRLGQFDACASIASRRPGAAGVPAADARGATVG